MDVRSLLGEGHPEYEADGITWLLGCNCAVAGCWPLEARVTIDAHTVTWTSFCQPFRPERDYSDFGPFSFDLREYETAIAELAEKYPSISPPMTRRAGIRHKRKP
jgi:hypothetical protein